MPCFATSAAYTASFDSLLHRQSSDGTSICKTFHFADFNAAWSFLSRTALLAEHMDHHPQWTNVYGCVDVTLTTQSCGGVSDKVGDDVRV